MTLADFEASARAAAPAIGMPMISVGPRIRLAVEATIDVVGHNTNLGIVLLAAPLVAGGAVGCARGLARQSSLRVLAGLSVEDARETYAAIRRPSPGGSALHRATMSARNLPSPCSRRCARPRGATASPGTTPTTLPIFSSPACPARSGAGAAAVAPLRHHGYLSRFPWKHSRHADRAQIRRGTR